MRANPTPDAAKLAGPPRSWSLGLRGRRLRGGRTSSCGHRSKPGRGRGLAVPEWGAGSLRAARRVRYRSQSDRRRPRSALASGVEASSSMAVAKLGGRNCRVGPGNFTPSPSQIPDLILSHHPARAIARRLPPSAEISGSSRCNPVGPSSTAMTRPLRLHGHYPASLLPRGSPPLSGASVLSASRLEPLAPSPLSSPVRFSRSAQEPD
jgi:hypothetical protein